MKSFVIKNKQKGHGQFALLSSQTVVTVVLLLYCCTRVTDRQKDRQTDGQNYDPQDRASIAASRGKTNKIILYMNKRLMTFRDICCDRMHTEFLLRIKLISNFAS